MGVWSRCFQAAALGGLYLGGRECLEPLLSGSSTWWTVSGGEGVFGAAAFRQQHLVDCTWGGGSVWSSCFQAAALGGLNLAGTGCSEQAASRQQHMAESDLFIDFLVPAAEAAFY